MATMEVETMCKTFSMHLKTDIDDYLLSVVKGYAVDGYIVSITDGKVIEAVRAPTWVISSFGDSVDTISKQVATMILELPQVDLILVFISVLSSSWLVDMCFMYCDGETRKIVLESRLNPRVELNVWVPDGCNPSWLSSRITVSKRFENIHIAQDRLNVLKNVLGKFTSLAGVASDDACGVAHKLSILMEGPPGTGKTSLIKAICRETNSNLVIVNMEGLSRIDKMAMSLPKSNDRKHTTVVALEDIHKLPKEMFGQLYGFLDGVYDLDNCIIVMTSNVPHNTLDTTLLRPGRVNHIIRLGCMDNKSVVHMANMLCPGTWHSHVERFAESVAALETTPAIVEVCLRQCVDTTEAFSMVKELTTAEVKGWMDLFKTPIKGSSALCI
jgi:hypothetical protein